MERIPPDLQKVLTKSAAASSKWKELTPIARRDFLSWIQSAKQEETRARRIKRTSEMLLAGKRRPCCYAVVPMGLYKALGENPKAQKYWRTLTPDQRRDINDWVGAPKEKQAREERIVKACKFLAAGKTRP